MLSGPASFHVSAAFSAGVLVFGLGQLMGTCGLSPLESTSFSFLAGDSDRLITGSADQTVRIWELATGKELFKISHREPCRAVKLSVGDGLLASTSDAFIESPPQIHIYRFAEDIEDQTDRAVLEWACPKGRITRVYWADLNRQLITSHDYGFVRRWDVEVSMV